MERPRLAATPAWVMWPRCTLSPARKPRIGKNRRDAAIRERKAIGERRIVQSMARRMRHDARHIGDAIMDDAVDNVDRLGMRRRTRRLETSALIDRDIDEHGAGLHLFQHGARHELRRAGAGNEHRADHGIGGEDFRLDRRG